MPKLCELVDSESELVIYIGTSAVRVVRHDPDDHGSTIIEFDENHHITVVGRVEEIVKKINNA